MRNSNCVAIAPTATISNIIGVERLDRADVQNLSVKSNLSGEFTVVNEYLVRDLKKLGLWDEVMVNDLKHFDGSLRRDRPRARGPEGALRDRVRGRAAVAGRGGGAAPEVDRPGAVAQHLHGRRLGQEARRDLQARLAARPEDDLLPAHAGRDARREVDGEGGPAERGVERAARGAVAPRSTQHRAGGAQRADEPATDVKFCALDNPDAKRASESQSASRRAATRERVPLIARRAMRHEQQQSQARGCQEVLGASHATLR